MADLLLQVGDVFKEGEELYVVYATQWEGGGTGHGPHDVWPDAWRVYAKPLSRDSTSDPIKFWQTGPYSPRRGAGTVPVYAKAEAIWSITEWYEFPR